jgi:four helix bundle protein
MASGVTNLIVFQKSFELAMKIFEVSKAFPKEEKYSLTDQIRRSSRSVSANLAEAYSKRSYKAHFISKVSDSDMENNETQIWLLFAYTCNYLTDTQFQEFSDLSTEVAKLLDFLIHNPEKFERKR